MKLRPVNKSALQGNSPSGAKRQRMRPSQRYQTSSACSWQRSQSKRICMRRLWKTTEVSSSRSATLRAQCSPAGITRPRSDSEHVWARHLLTPTQISDEIAKLKYKEPQSTKIVQLEQELVRAEAQSLVAEAQLTNIVGCQTYLPLGINVLTLCRLARSLKRHTTSILRQRSSVLR